MFWISCHNIVTTQFWHSCLGIRCCHCWRRPQWTGGCKLPCKMWCEDRCAREETCSWWEVNKDMRRSRSKQALHLHQHQLIKISGSRRCCCHWGDCSRIQIFQSKLCSQSSPASDLQWIGTEEAWAEGVLARDWEVHSHQTWLGAAGEARVSHSWDVW